VRPLNEIGDARWSDNLGFLRPGAPPADTGVTEGVSKAPPVKTMTLNLATLRFGIGRARVNATNDGMTADDTAFYTIDAPIDFRYEWRKPDSLFAPWFDCGAAMLGGERTLVDGSGMDTAYSMSLLGLRFQGRVGLDVHPFEYIGAGPFAGAHIDFYDATLKEETTYGASSDIPDAGFVPDAGPLFGLHARFRTKARPGQPSAFYFDPAYTWRLGSFQNARYVSAEAGVRTGAVYLIGWYEQRVGSSGHFTYSLDDSGRNDANNLSEAFAASMPIDRRFGLALSVIVSGT
jgi:hypothetical protein